MKIMIGWTMEVTWESMHWVNLQESTIYLQVFIACGIGKSGDKAEDPFRKPEPGMWHIMEQHFNSGIAINMDQLFPYFSLFFKPQFSRTHASSILSTGINTII